MLVRSADSTHLDGNLGKCRRVDSINTVAEWFFAGFTRVTSTETKAEERSDVYDVSALET